MTRDDFIGYNVVDLAKKTEMIKPENEVCKALIKLFFQKYILFFDFKIKKIN